jgi:FkbM family methyltransferase
MHDAVRRSKASVGRLLGNFGVTKSNVRIARLRKQLLSASPGSVVNFAGYRIRITDAKGFYIQCKDEFIHQIYHFDSTRDDPLIIDGGSNIGVSILYFKQLYRNARIIGFEPDPSIYKLLQENISENGIEGVMIRNSGLGAQAGVASFVPDNSAGGRIMTAGSSITVKVERLSDWIDQPVDFLKLNIEGEELPVLQELETSNTLSKIRELVFEYHGWPEGEQRLGEILELLSRNGFRYLVHDFDNETGFATKPPFSWDSDTTWYCLVYARNVRA